MEYEHVKDTVYATLDRWQKDGADVDWNDVDDLTGTLLADVEALENANWQVVRGYAAQWIIDV
jgi:hypothetical protein